MPNPTSSGHPTSTRAGGEGALGELTQLYERAYTERFAALMYIFLPDWRARSDQLNATPLVEEEWGDA